jgi:aryl-alcohol dehydrogenase-like predicted oxidoreductase
MRYRRFGRLGWSVGEVGFGMWGMGSWTDSDDDESLSSLQLALDLGCNFFDTAFAYGDGHSERLLGQLVRSNPDRTIHVATKVPPLNRTWPSQPGYPIRDVFPPHHIRELAARSLENLGVPAIDLLQFHVWEDAWADDDGWQRVMDDLRSEGMVRAVGISVNRWEPANGMRTLRTGLIDAVQVIYNIFDQAPEDELFPLCRELDIAAIARVPFDEGSLTGTLGTGSRWPDGDFRNMYFGPQNLGPTLDRIASLATDIPPDMTMPELALRFILSDDDVSVVIPGMRKPDHVRANIKASDAGPLDEPVRAALRRHRWDRSPTVWSG